jgi:hypothetical protein
VPVSDADKALVAAGLAAADLVSDYGHIRATNALLMAAAAIGRANGATASAFAMVAEVAFSRVDDAGKAAGL